MNIERNQAPPQEVGVSGLAGRSPRPHGGWALVGIVASVVLVGAAFPRQQPQSPSGSGGSNTAPNATSVQAAPAQLNAPGGKPAKPTDDSAGPLTNQQIAEDSATLLRLATDLKAEVDKTNKDTLSMRVVKKADEIERLAHSVRARMKSVVAAN